VNLRIGDAAAEAWLILHNDPNLSPTIVLDVVAKKFALNPWQLRTHWLNVQKDCNWRLKKNESN